MLCVSSRPYTTQAVINIIYSSVKYFFLFRWYRMLPPFKYSMRTNRLSLHWKAAIILVIKGELMEASILRSAITALIIFFSLILVTVTLLLFFHFLQGIHLLAFLVHYFPDNADTTSADYSQ